MSRPHSSNFTSHPAEASLPPLRTSAPRNPTPATPAEPSPELDHLHPDVSADTTAVDSHINTNVNGQGHGQEQGNGTSTSFSVLRTQPGGSGFEDWEAEYERQKNRAWEEKVKSDLQGWRGGHGTPRSSYPQSALPPMSYFHQPVTGEIGKHLPKEMVRIERDWSGGEMCQFETIFPLELEGRIQPSQLFSFLNAINAKFVEAYAMTPNIIDNLIALATLWTSLLWKTSHFEKKLNEVEGLIEDANRETFNKVGLNVLSPRDVALQFLLIEVVLTVAAGD
uniref:Ras modification protein ERF4 n=1 Tax=Cryptococcus bacillisporus CA1280 TaxID=1296109 RepID=A0A0D0VHX4_CRYGA|nr:hypothetical protein I312_03902 [Cryptococcus bacillisporus CA1280]